MNLYLTISILNLIFSSIPLIESAKILGIFPTRSRSHQAIHQTIINGLVAKGHEVTIITHFKSNNSAPNYKEISFPSKGNADLMDTIDIKDGVNLIGVQKYIELSRLYELPLFEQTVKMEYIEQLINSKEKPINLIIAEGYTSRCYNLLAHKLNVPLILVSPPTKVHIIDHLIGVPNNPSFSTFLLSKFTTKMNFFQRLTNTFYFTVLNWYHNYGSKKDMERFARDIFNMELPSDEELNKRAALGLYNNHFSFISTPKPPNAINIAGIHITEPKKLPKDVEDFIEESDHGVIFFSFGSTLKASSIPPEKLEVIKKVFSAIPQRVIWRVNELNITEVSSNVKLGKWFPQRDILEHENVVGFISHCGLLGTLEAIHTATPIIGMPIGFDQPQNANLLVENEVGIYVDLLTMDESTLLNAINEVVNNSKYRENMQKLSRVFRDRPMSPLDEAVYWVEYVLKHKGAPHLRIEAADMPLYQYLLLDVLLFILASIIGIVYFFIFLLKIMIISQLRHYRSTKNKIQ